MRCFSKASIKYLISLLIPKEERSRKRFGVNQKQNPPVGYCTVFTEKKLELGNKRKLERQNRTRNEYYQFEQENVETTEEIDDDIFVPEFVEEQPYEKRTRYQYSEVMDNPEDDLPYRYRHIRHGIRGVRPEIYTTITKLQSKYHMSKCQAEGAIITVANELFGRKEFGEWMIYSPDAESTNNTLPAMSNTRRTEPYMEAMTLSLIVEEIMSGDDVCVVYSNDSSAQSGVGNYVVQSFTINGTPRSLPTFGIITETRESLAELMKCTLDILSATSGHKYTTQDIIKKIDFVMTDSTSHNLNVIKTVCKDLAVEDTPAILVCNVHPLMLFQPFRRLHQAKEEHVPFIERPSIQSLTRLFPLFGIPY